MQLVRGEAKSIRTSPELVAVVLRWMAARERHDVRVLTNLFSESDHIRYVGSDGDELFGGHVLRDGYAAHVEELPPFVSECDRVEAFEAGAVGWADWIGRFITPGREDPIRIRFSWVFVLEEGVWKIAHVHVSHPRSNLETIGRRHFALQALVDAARESGELGETDCATILFTDVVNSTSIAASIGDREWSRRIGRHYEGVREIVESQGGKLVKTLGDGTMSSFPTPRGALRAVRAMMRAARDGDVEPRLMMRAGLHTGEIIRSRGDFFGSVVNKAARLAALAEPGAVLVSGETRERVADDQDFRFDGPVTVALRGLEGTQALYRLLWPEEGAAEGVGVLAEVAPAA